MDVIVGSDHAGFELKLAVVEHLKARGHAVQDLGCHDRASTDYPDHAAAVAQGVAARPEALGVLVCGTGQGMCMAANKVPGVRAGVCGDTFSARAIREHNDANVLCLGSRVTGGGLALDIVDAFLSARFEGGRHARRVEKINALQG